MKLFLLYILVCSAFNGANAATKRIGVDSVTATKDDEYICQTHQLTDDQLYITDFKPDLNRKLVHHMLLYVCKEAVPGIQRDCYSPCAYGSEMRIIYSWAHQATDFQLPANVSFNAGTATGWKNLVIQVHYKDRFESESVKDSSGIVLTYQTDKTKYTAGIYLFAAAQFIIYPGLSDVRAVMTCTMNINYPLYVFAVRVHTHSRGRAVGVFAKNGSNWDTVFEKSPQRAQAFYPLSATFEVTKGRNLAARCVFDSSNEKEPVLIGASRDDEMCNAYLMFYTTAESYAFDVCTEPNSRLDLPEPDTTEIAFRPYGQQHYGHGSPNVNSDGVSLSINLSILLFYLLLLFLVKY